MRWIMIFAVLILGAITTVTALSNASMEDAEADALSAIDSSRDQ